MNSNVVLNSGNATAARFAAILTDRENEILSSLSRGHANKEIAAQMNITVPTVRTHLRHIYEKIAVRSRSEAIVKYFNETRPACVPQGPATTSKTVPVRDKRATHRYGRRKVPEFLRHSVDAEENSVQFEQFVR
jgi:DNA-binding CsgD family transcriptional regulator